SRHPMRVGLVTYGLDRPLSGTSRYTLELARAVCSLHSGPQIVVLAAGGLGPLSSLELPWARLHGCRRLPALAVLGALLIPWISRRLKLEVVHDPNGVAPLVTRSTGF